jgi:hypothetical protein
MGETRVDLLQLLEDLRDAYPGSLEETILTEIVANALDSGASRITLSTDPATATLTAVDDGRGMTRAELRRYHDLATTSKQRGRGIGFAGVGIKLGLLACESVLTESRSGDARVATRWHLKSRHRAPWQWVDPTGLVAERGTALQLLVPNALSELLDEAFIEATVRRHFQPLFEREFDAMFAARYPDGLSFLVNGRVLQRDASPPGRVPVEIRLPRKRTAAAMGYVFRAAEPLADHERGIAIATLGKVIKRGWDWLGLTPAGADRIAGLIEAPALAESLTLNKADFLRTGPRGAAYLGYRKAIQQALADPLATWGESHDGDKESERRQARPLERDLRDVLADLTHDFPLLAALTERRPGGQRKLALGGEGESDAALEPFVSEPADRDTEQPSAPDAADDTAPASPAPPKEATAELGAGERKHRAQLGLRIHFESRPDDSALGRLVESTIWVNDAHPAYQRAFATRMQAYHLAVTVAMTLAPLAVEAPHVHEFVSAFLERWGAVGERKRRV